MSQWHLGPREERHWLRDYQTEWIEQSSITFVYVAPEPQYESIVSHDDRTAHDTAGRFTSRGSYKHLSDNELKNKLAKACVFDVMISFRPVIVVKKRVASDVVL